MLDGRGEGGQASDRGGSGDFGRSTPMESGGGGGGTGARGGAPSYAEELDDEIPF